MTTAYTASNSVPLGAAPTVNGIVQQFVVGTTNPADATFAPDGYAAAPIFGLGGVALQGNEMVANSVATLVSYVGPLLNSGALCWILFDCPGGTLQVPNATASHQAVPLGQADARYAMAGASGLIGSVIDWPFASAPASHLLCNGAVVSSATYAALFTLSVKSLAGATISIASPAVIGWPSHPLYVNAPVKFTTTGALPSGLTAGTTYYVISAGFGANSFQVSATIGGAAINTSGTQSGVHTAINAPYGCANDLSTFNLPNIPAGYTTVQASANEGTTTVGQVIAHTHALPGSILTYGTPAGSGVLVQIGTSDTGSTGGSANLAAG